MYSYIQWGSPQYESETDMDEQTVQRKKKLINFLYFAVILAIIIFLCRKGLSVLLPFVVAFLISLLLRPAVAFFYRKLHIKKAISAIALTLIFYAVIGTLLVLFGFGLLGKLRDIAVGIPSWYQATIAPRFSYFGNRIQVFLQTLSPETAKAVSGFLTDAYASLSELVSSITGSAIRALSSYALSIPKGIVNVVLTVVATIFMTLDYPFLKQLILAQMSEEKHEKLHAYKIHLKKTLGRYVRSYALLLLITFVELTIGFLIFGLQKPVGLAAMIAVVDILPILGIGTILIPWFIYLFVVGNYVLGIEIALLYIVLTIIRQIIEPKIVGDHVGLHPIITLLSMIVGTYVFGPIGLLGLPVTIALIKSLQDAGVIHIYNDPGKTENAVKEHTENKGE